LLHYRGRFASESLADFSGICTQTTERLSYGQFKTLLKRGQVTDLVIRDKEISGSIKPEAIKEFFTPQQTRKLGEPLLLTVANDKGTRARRIAQSLQGVHGFSFLKMVMPKMTKSENERLELRSGAGTSARALLRR
jgi:hypothetical protein